MENADKLFPPVDYSPLWLILGIILFVAIAVYITVILFCTRHKNPLPKIVKPVDLPTLKNKYIALIDEVAALYQHKRISNRIAHQQLSSLIRYFIFEASGFRAHLMTLSDITKTKHQDLAGIIRQYYPSEFSRIESGDVAVSIDNAKRIVERWH